MIDPNAINPAALYSSDEAARLIEKPSPSALQKFLRRKRISPADASSRPLRWSGSDLLAAIGCQVVPLTVAERKVRNAGAMERLMAARFGDKAGIVKRCMRPRTDAA
jgi:hypothetical protein